MGLLKKLGKKLKFTLGKILDSIGEMSVDQNLVEDFSASNFRSKLTIRHFKKVIKDDLQALKEEGVVDLFVRWGQRVGELMFFVPGLMQRRFLTKRIEKNRQVLKEVQIKEVVEIKSFPYSLSIVINTKNSPPFFKEILQKYKNQVGFRKIEIIIVDSGSTDDTLKLAKYYGCKIIQIRPEEFRHGRSRNIGVEAATGKYIINAVSDATPSTLDLAYKVVLKLEEKKAVAVSVRQIPKFEADLYAAWMVWQHNQFMFGSGGEEVWVYDVKNFDSLPYLEKRQACLIDDVFVLHWADSIKKEKYNEDIRYAEDLLLSISYIKQNKKIGSLQSESVIHSHTKPAEYFLKRHFVDGNIIFEVLGTIGSNISDGFIPASIQEIDNSLHTILYAAKLKSRENQENLVWLAKYLDFFDGKVRINESLVKDWDRLYKNLHEQLLSFRLDGESYPPDGEISSKIAAQVSGLLLSEFVSKLKTKDKRAEEKVGKFIKLLEVGI